jgi:hypothetical protein
MFSYRIGILPLIHRLKIDFPAVQKRWYANDAGAGGSFTDLQKFSLSLQEIGPAYSYFREPLKSILIVRANNCTRAKSTFEDLSFKVQSGSCQDGGYIGSKANHELWVQEKVTFWTSAVVTDLAFAALSQPQTALAGLQKSLQHKWQFIQRARDDIGNCFFDVKAAIAHIFLLVLYRETMKDCTYIGAISQPFPSSSMALPSLILQPPLKATTKQAH